MDRESRNADAYSDLGEQIIESIVRARMILVYFMMQVALFAAALTSAGAFKSSKTLIRSGGWCAGIALAVALLSYAVNKPIAVMVEDSVEVLVRADNDMSDLNEEEREMPLMQLLAYCKPVDESEDASGFDLSFAADLANQFLDEPVLARTPAAVKLVIEDATIQMDALLAYFQRTPSMIEAMGNSIELLPIVSHVFDAVKNVISIIDCGVAFKYFRNMIEVLDVYAMPSFVNIAWAEKVLCFLLVCVFVVSR